MILAVSGISMTQNNKQQAEYKQEFYQPHTKIEFKEDIKKDFGDIFAVETNKLKIDVLI